jgi:probable F420-dependent oxidoreductase
VSDRALTGVGIWSGGLRRHPDEAEIRAAVAELEELGFSALFIPGGPSGDEVFDAVDRALDSTRSIPVVTGIISVWAHEAAKVSAFFARTEERHPGRFIAGLGVSHAPLVDKDDPGRYRKPLDKMREYLDELDVPKERRLLAALAPKMLELARDRALGAHPYFVPVEHTRVARGRLGPEPILAVEQAVLLETDPTRARELARRHMTVYLTLPNYVRALLAHGFTEEDVADGGSDRLVDGIVAWGDESAIAERIAAHREAGADHVCLQVVSELDQNLPLEDWRRLATLAR